ncbi:MAG: ferritin-like domain-containing protein, partial [Reyranellaceae bacterium]
FNLINAEQKQVIYAKYGLDWQWVRDAVKEVFSDDDRREMLKESTNIFRVLIKTLLHAGIITQRTAPLYAVWVDMKELKAEGEDIPGDVVADEMLVVLREINAKRRHVASKGLVAA